MSARFAPTPIRAAVQKLPADEQAALHAILAAAQIMDSLFLRKVAGDNVALYLHLAEDTSPLGRARFDYFAMKQQPAVLRFATHARCGCS